MDEESDFGKRLRAKRMEKNFSQDDLAKALGKQHRTTISNWEKGKQQPNLSEVKQLAILLGTTVGYLADGEPVPEGYILVRKEDWQDKNQRIITIQEELLHYQRQEITRQRSA